MKCLAGRLAAAFATFLTVASMSATAEEFKFDANEFEKKVFEFSGYLEQKEDALKLRSSSPAFKLAYPGEAERTSLLRNTTTLEASGKLNLGSVVGDVRGQSVYSGDSLGQSISTNTLMEGGLRWSADPSLTFDAGKRVQRWGKGYSWNPVGFVERAKDPADPQASRQGYVMASGEWTKSLSGPISTVGVTGLVVPTNDSMNSDFGEKKDLNPAAKLYLLALDTDIDLMWRGKGARPQSFGFDFSRNLSTALEVHGEWARSLDAPPNTVAASGATSSPLVNFNSYLLGLRFLTESEVTWIAEYYRNGEGYGKPEPGRHYLYLKASVNEPFDWVYGVASLTAMTNLNDRSFQITPEISYTGVSNLELRARLIILGGQPHTEFGEKIASSRVEVYVRYFF